MWGFPVIAKDEFIKILINDGYGLIIIDQITKPPNLERAVTAILSSTLWAVNSSTTQSPTTQSPTTIKHIESLMNSLNL